MIVAFLLFLSSAAFALELTEDFDDDSYASSMLWITQGATHTYEASGGWRGGAAKFTPPTSEGYSGLANFGSINARRVNVRFLYYMGSTYNDIPDNNKWMIINRSPYGDGTRVIIMQHPYAAHNCNVGACYNVDCGYSAYGLALYINQWICVEIESDLDANRTRVFLTTQDGVYNGTVIVSNTISSPGTGNHDQITILGGYYQGSLAPHANRFVKYDELRISTAGYIGPPPGFLGSGQKPAAPQGLRIVN
jgi:hypothetical protein